MEKNIIVTKMSGEKAPFSEQKLTRSLQRSGAGKESIDNILSAIKDELYEGISTREIYRIAFSMLKKKARSTAARYKLKNAIMELGPSGYPFEQYVAEILKYQGYKVQTGVTVEGFCVKHEVDVIAEKDDSHFIVECKFHNKQGYICDVKITLYINSRFLDIEKKRKTLQENRTKFHQAWIFTNTRFSDDALQYGNCAGLKLIGWDYPKQGNLKEWIDVSGLHPVTCLTSLTKSEKSKILERKIVLCKDLQLHPSILDELDVRTPRKEKVLKECADLCALLENQVEK